MAFGNLTLRIKETQLLSPRKELLKKVLDRANLAHDLVSKLKELAVDGVAPSRPEFCEQEGVTDYRIKLAGGFETLVRMAGLESRKPKKKIPELLIERGPRILIIDIETAPMELYGYGLRDQNFSINQIKQDWYVLSWAAKWHDAPADQIMYADNRHAEDITDDYGIISQIWQLLMDADIVVGQNSVKFDTKKLNARFIKHGFPPPTSYRQIDTYKIGRKVFGFTSYKLEYMSGLLCKKYQKLKHAKFSGFELWLQCLKRNPEAWEEMELYNKYDILSTEELWTILRPYDKTINLNVYFDSMANKCFCGSSDLKFTGYVYTNAARKERYNCAECNCEFVGRENILSKEKKQNLLR